MMRRFLFAMVFGLVAVTASAQQTMAIHFYLVPKIGAGTSTKDAFRAKYIADWTRRWDAETQQWINDHPTDPAIEYQSMDYGVEATFLVMANVTSAQHTEISANLDVTAIPNPIGDTVSAVAVTKARSSLESAMLPGTWVTTTNTWADVLKTTAHVIQVMQRFSGMFGRLFSTGVTLDTTMNQLTAGQRQNFRDAAASLGVDTSGATGATTVRDALLLFAAQMPSLTFTLAGQSFTF